MKLQNISNKNALLTLFCRNNDGTQEIKIVKDCLPYYYEPSETQDAIGYDGTALQKFLCNTPKEVREQKSSNSYEADIWHTKRYIIDKIDQIEPSKTKIVLFDIEVKAKKLPRPREEKEAIYPISCITIYDNYSKTYKTFFIEDYPSEYELLEDFCTTIKTLAPDVLGAWNIEFDYLYLYYRVPDFARKISPIAETRWSAGIDYPAGISIVDMLGLYHKYVLGKKDSYALMDVANDELGYAIIEDTDFENIHEAKEKNFIDVEKMVKLDEKLQLFEYFDEIRLLSKCLWEDLPSEKRNNQWQSNNSKVIDMLALTEAKKLNVVLPSKYGNQEKVKIDGARRLVKDTGFYKNLQKVDISGAYPQMILDFCLSPENFVDVPGEDTLTIPVWSRETKEKPSELIATYHVKQNPNAILPSLVRHLVTMKKEWKDKLNSVKKGTEEYKKLETKYNSRKALVNSAYGVIALVYFRLYDYRVAETITFLVRDILLNAEQQLQKHQIPVIYLDTDSFFYQGDTDLTDLLNQWTYQWGVDKFNNPNTNIEFEYEGYFSEIFIVALCRYIGNLQTAKGEKVEIKGIQMKRKDSGAWVKKFQETILKKWILKEQSKKAIMKWVEQQIDALQKAPLLDIAIPCRFSKPREDYGNSQPYFEALDETQKLIPEFVKEIGTRFWWIYTIEPKTLALDKKHVKHIKQVNWIAMIERNIIKILVPIFKGLKWEIDLLDLAEKNQVIVSSTERKKLFERFDAEETIRLKKYYSAREVKKD